MNNKKKDSKGVKMTTNQRRAYTEMLEIFKNMSLDLQSKVPNTLIEKMNLEKDNDWKFKYDETVTLKNQKILYSTKVLFSYIYINYIGTNEKRKKLIMMYEKNSKTKYNLDTLFKKNNMQTNQHDKKDINTNMSS